MLIEFQFITGLTVGAEYFEDYFVLNLGIARLIFSTLGE